MRTNMVEKVFRWIGKLTGRLPKRTRDIISIISVACVFLLNIMHGSDCWPWRDLVFIAINCMLWGLVLLMQMKADMHLFRMKWIPSVLWLGVGAFMLLSAVMYTNDYLAEAFAFLILMPIAWQVFANNDTSHIFSLLCRGAIWSFRVYLIVCVLLFPATERYYRGCFINANGAAIYLAPVACCILFELITSRLFSAKWFRMLLLLAVSLALIFYTGSRTGEFSVLVAFLIILLIRLYSTHEWKRILLQQALPILLAGAIAIPSVIYLFQIRTLFSTVVSEQTATEGASDRTEEKTVSVENYITRNIGKLDASGKSLDKYSSGRVSIWKVYIDELRLTGHDRENLPTTIYYREDGTTSERQFSNSHLTVIDYAYRHGILCGVLFLLFNIYNGIAAVVYAARKNAPASVEYPLLITLCFGIISAVDAACSPFLFVITMYYGLVQAPLVLKNFPEEV